MENNDLIGLFNGPYVTSWVMDSVYKKESFHLKK